MMACIEHGGGPMLRGMAPKGGLEWDMENSVDFPEENVARFLDCIGVVGNVFGMEHAKICSFAEMEI